MTSQGYTISDSLDTFSTEDWAAEVRGKVYKGRRGAVQIPQGTLKHSVGQDGLIRGQGVLQRPHLGLT